ncbi:hypothetical protein ACI77O_13060 [Pseudomonas tritici]|uniref:hypothetical protein n=1 Tax=Pseudomonas tritici TaxID=2745518 RepID=UPI00387AE942
MNSSTQIITAPTLRQFATSGDDQELIVTSKLGVSTLSRVRFKRLDYPRLECDQTGFIKGLVLQDYPVAAEVLGHMFDKCISDQAAAVNVLLAG